MTKKYQTQWYILDKRRNVVPSDAAKASEFKWGIGGNKRCTVAKTAVGDSFVSTVFLSLDHNIGEGKKPVLFETLYNDKDGEHIQRYSTWAEAALGHMEIVEQLLAEADV